MKNIFSSLEHELGEPVKIFEESIEKIEKFVLTQIEFLERDYERKEGYVGLLYGMIGVSASSLLFPGHVIYGVFALLGRGRIVELTQFKSPWLKILGGGLGNLSCLAITWLAIGFHTTIWAPQRTYAISCP